MSCTLSTRKWLILNIGYFLASKLLCSIGPRNLLLGNNKMIRKCFAFLTLALSASLACANVLPAASYVIKNSTSYSYDANKSSTPYTTGVLVDFTLSYTGTLQNNDFVAVWFNNSTNTEGYKGVNIGLKANCDGKCKNDLFVRGGGLGNGTFFSNSDIKAGQFYHLYAYLYKSDVSGNYDRLSAWLNPTAAELTDLTKGQLNLNVNTGFSAFDTIGIRTANIDNKVTVNLNNLNVNEVPEPGSVALMGLALAGLALVRRNKRG